MADLYRSALVQQTRASLNALEQALRSAPQLSADAVAVLLERWGDALRLDERVSAELRSIAGQIDVAVLDEVLRRRTEEVNAWIVPAPNTQTTDEDLVFMLCRRDETESLLQGLTRLMLSRGGLPADVSAVEPLCDALARLDAELARSVDHASAEAALGVRIALHEEETWLDVLPFAEPKGVAEPIDRSDWAALAGLTSASPSDTLVDRYIRRGALRAYVEAYALRDADFSSDLAGAIDDMERIGEPVSLMAAVWRKRQAARPISIGYAFMSDFRAAAASEPIIARGVQRHELGPLPGVAAEAALEYRGGDLTLIVYPERALKRVQLGEVECAAPDSEGRWVVRSRIDEQGSSLGVIVVDEVGGHFEGTFDIELRQTP